MANPGESPLDEALRSQGIDPVALDAQISARRVATEHAAGERKAKLETLKGELLLKELKADHWFWHWGSADWREWADAPEGMIDPDIFLNIDTQELKSFLEELQRDGIELTTDPEEPERFFVDRVKFMEWLILRYVRDAPTFTKDEMEAYAAEKVEEARATWEHEAEEERVEQGNEQEELKLEAEAARSGWIPLKAIAEHTGVHEDEVFQRMAERYRLGMLPSRSVPRWAAMWPDAFEWMREHFEVRWTTDTENTPESIRYLVEQGMDEAVATDKARRAFANTNAALPISKHMGVHTLNDKEHLFEGHQLLGISSSGEAITESNDWPWDPRSKREAEAGFPLWGEGRDY